MITEIRFPQRHGVRAATLSGLSNLVILAGPNGSGKSRYLDLVIEVAAEAEKARDELRPATEELERKKGLHLEDWEKTERTYLMDRIATFKASIAAITFSDDSHRKVIKLEYATPDMKLHSASGLPRADVGALTKHTSEGGFRSSFLGMHVYLTHVAEILWGADRLRSSNESRAADLLKETESFNSILSALLGVSVEPAFVDSMVVPLLRGRPFNSKEL